MNLIEARKLAHEGWVRSPTRTAEYIRFTTAGHETQSGLTLCEGACAEDLEAEDWEPRPVPQKPFEADVWVHNDGSFHKFRTGDIPEHFVERGWRKIRVREVSSPEESSPVVAETCAPVADIDDEEVRKADYVARKQIREVAAGSSSSVFRCRKCGGICFTEQGATTCCWNHP